MYDADLSWIERLGWTLLHTLWQGALIWLVLQVMLIVMRRKSAQARYLVSCGALLAMVVIPWLTFSAQDITERVQRERNGESAGPSITSTIWNDVAPLGRASKIRSFTPYIKLTNVAGAHRQEFSEQGIIRLSLPWLVALWWCGVLFFAMRLFVGWRAVAQLAASQLKPLDEVWQTRWLRLRLQAGVKQLVGMGETAAVQVPSVAGWLKPVVLLPVGVLAGMPVEQVEAILLHELAHIRRHDITVNLIQSLAETLFFYHPAVWSVSNRIRQERELACDDMAIAWCNDRLGYAEALAAFEGMRAEGAQNRLSMAATGRAASRKAPEGDLLSRIRRVLQGVEPRHPMPSSRMLTLSGLAAVGVYLLSMFTVPVLASDILLAEERIKAVKAAREKSLSPDEKAEEQAEPRPGEKAKKIHVFGTFKTEDNAPVPQQMQFIMNSMTGSSGVSATVGRGVQGDKWEHDIWNGRLSLAVWAPGYAPVRLSAMTVRDTESGPHELVLKKGIAARIRVVDPDGKPLSDAKLNGWLPGSLRQPMLNVAEVTTDAHGEVYLGQVTPDTLLQLQASREGFQMDQKEIRVWPTDGVVTWTLSRAVPASGTIVDEITGKPIPGAKLSLASSRTPIRKSYMCNPPDHATALGKCNEQGMFTMNFLNSNSNYYVYAMAPGYAVSVFPVQTGDTDMVVRMKKGLRIKGKIVDEKGLLKDALQKKEKVEIIAERSIKSCPDVENGYNVTAEVKLKENELTFEFVDLAAGPVTLYLTVDESYTFQQSMRRQSFVLGEDITDYRFPVEKLPNTLEAANPSDPESGSASKASLLPVRTIRIRLDPGNGLPPPTGKIEIQYDSAASDTEVKRVETVSAHVSSGYVSVVLPVPNNITVSPVGLTGYWFKETQIAVPEARLHPGPHIASQEKWSTTIPVLPAGMIHGKVAVAPSLDGQSFFTSVVMLDPPPGIGDVSLNINDGRQTEAESYVAGPLPLGGTYAVVLWNSPMFSASDPIRLDEKTPVVEVPIHLKEGRELRAVFVDEDSKPIPLTGVEFHYNHLPRGSFASSIGSTTRSGAITIPGVNFDLPGYYTLRLPFDSWIPSDVRIDKNTPLPVTIHCKRRKEN
ncbi:MAG: M56 family metallopeptidase [Candidatus Methylacidiphilales bacterium]